MNNEYSDEEIAKQLKKFHEKITNKYEFATIILHDKRHESHINLITGMDTKRAVKSIKIALAELEDKL